MVVDASVWVSYFLAGDANHEATVDWLEGVIRAGSLFAPFLLLPEIAGAFARRSGSVDLGLEVAQELRDLPSLTLVPLEADLADLSIHVAATLPLRGPDAVYVATAEMLDVPLVTWDSEQRSRGALVVPTRSPGEPG